MTVLAGAASLCIGNAYQAQMPEFATDLGHGHVDFSYSALLAADAAGALVAGFVLESRGLLQARAPTACVLAMIWCAALGSFALSSSYVLALLLLFVARSEEHTSELQSLMRISYAVFCLKKKNTNNKHSNNKHISTQK